MNNKLMTHMVCGYPSIPDSKDIFEILDKHSDYIEVQFPFSDPIADGPIIEEANKVSLKNGTKIEDCFRFLEDIKILKPKSKVLIMTYYNIVYNFGIDNFFKEAQNKGIYGCIVPDIVYDTNDFKKFFDTAKKYGIHVIQTVSPVTSEKRIDEIKKYTSGFVYAISQNMTTGSLGTFGKDFQDYILNLKRDLNIPIGVGFGIKTKNNVESVLKNADFAIIGSESVRKYNEGGIVQLDKYLKQFSN